MIAVGSSQKTLAHNMYLDRGLTLFRENFFLVNFSPPSPAVYKLQSFEPLSHARHQKSPFLVIATFDFSH